MISIYKTDNIKVDEDETIIYGELRGLSTDTKPTDEYKGKKIGNGCVFIEINTGKIFFFDGDSKTWKEA
jgi:hypothetical protein